MTERTAGCRSVKTMHRDVPEEASVAHTVWPSDRNNGYRKTKKKDTSPSHHVIHMSQSC